MSEEAGTKKNLDSAYAPVSNDLLNAPVLFGLREQGKFQIVGEMLADGYNWEEIGREIGWEGQAAKRFWLMELETFNALREPHAENETTEKLK